MIRLHRGGRSGGERLLREGRLILLGASCERREGQHRQRRRVGQERNEGNSSTTLDVHGVAVIIAHRAILLNGRSGRIAASDVVSQVVDVSLLVFAGLLDEIADRDEPNELFVLHHRKVTAVLFGHDRHGF